MASAIHPTVGRWRRVDNAAGLSTRTDPAPAPRAGPRNAWMASAIHPTVGRWRRVDNAARLIHASLPGTQRPGPALATRGWLWPSTLRLAGGVGWITPQAYPRVPIRHTAPGSALAPRGWLRPSTLRLAGGVGWITPQAYPRVPTRNTLRGPALAPRGWLRPSTLRSAGGVVRRIHAYRPGTSAQGLPSHRVDGFGHPPYGWHMA